MKWSFSHSSLYTQLLRLSRRVAANRIKQSLVFLKPSVNHRTSASSVIWIYAYTHAQTCRQWVYTPCTIKLAHTHTHTHTHTHRSTVQRGVSFLRVKITVTALFKLHQPRWCEIMANLCVALQETHWGRAVRKAVCVCVCVCVCV